MNVPDLDPGRAPPLPTPTPLAQAPTTTSAIEYKGPLSLQPFMARQGGALKWIVGTARNGLLIVGIVGLIQFIMPESLKPGTLIGSFQGSVDSAELAEKQAAQAAFHTAVAAARAEGERSVTARYEAQIATLNRDLEVTSGGYQTLYQRSNQLAQGFIQIQSQMLQYRQQAIARTQGGASVAANLSGFMCSLGMISGESNDPGGFCAGTRRVQEGMQAEIDQRGISYDELSTALFGGLPDPATMRVGQDQRLGGTAAVTSPSTTGASGASQ